MRCAQCNNQIAGESRAAISGSIMGDEVTEVYYFCPACRVYTVEVCRDRFLGEEEDSTRGPLTEAEGDEKAALIRQCSEPWDKKCRCPAHRTYFGKWLD
jgi:hypothetical protein